MQQRRNVACTLLAIDLAGKSLIGTCSLSLTRSNKKFALMHRKRGWVPFRRNKSTRFQIGTGIVEDRHCIRAGVRHKQPVAVRSDGERYWEISSVTLLRKLCAQIEDVSARTFDHCDFICISERNIQTGLIRTKEKRGWMRPRPLRLCRRMKLDHPLQLAASEIDFCDARCIPQAHVAGIPILGDQSCERIRTRYSAIGRKLDATNLLRSWNDNFGGIGEITRQHESPVAQLAGYRIEHPAPRPGNRHRCALRV